MPAITWAGPSSPWTGATWSSKSTFSPSDDSDIGPSRRRDAFWHRGVGIFGRREQRRFPVREKSRSGWGAAIAGGSCRETRLVSAIQGSHTAQRRGDKRIIRLRGQCAVHAPSGMKAGGTAQGEGPEFEIYFCRPGSAERSGHQDRLRAAGPCLCRFHPGHLRPCDGAIQCQAAQMMGNVRSGSL